MKCQRGRKKRLFLTEWKKNQESVVKEDKYKYRKVMKSGAMGSEAGLALQKKVTTKNMTKSRISRRETDGWKVSLFNPLSSNGRAKEN